MINISGNVIKQSPVTSPLEPMCRQVPKEDCNQVQKTTYEYVTKQQMSLTLSVLIQEKTCQISQKPVQDQVQRRKCSLKMNGDCSRANDVNKQCYTVQDDQDLNVLISPELSGHQTQGFLQQ